MDRHSIREAQEKYLDGIRNEQPELFQNPTLIEDDAFLRQYGISIPNKSSFSSGIIKLFPQDFIVEEVLNDGTVITINTPEGGPTAYLASVAIPESKVINATLVKCGMSTIEAIEDIAKLIGCDRTQIAYAGIKDKNALTSQRVSFKNIPPEKIRLISSPHYFIKDLQPASEPIQKGAIKGNRFSIYARMEQAFFEPARSAAFLESFKKVKADGFYNFYYLQRFGMPRLLNIHVGTDIMRGNYEEAVRKIILEKSPQENQFMTLVRDQLAQTRGDFNAMRNILTPVPILFQDELTLIEYLIKHPGNWLGALKQILDKISIIVYSVPSLFFNEQLSMLIEQKHEIPPELPLLLSDDQADIEMYREFLRAMGLYPFSFKYIEQFSVIKKMKRMVSTIDHADVHNIAVTDHGFVISFSLGKGEYATTFLAHLMNLISGTPPENINMSPIDIRSALNEGNLNNEIEYFRSVIERTSGPSGVGSNN